MRAFGRPGPLIALCLSAALGLAACVSPPPAAREARPEETRALLAGIIPQAVRDRDAWIEDIEADFRALRLAPTRANLCAVVAVIEQESGFRVDPVVPDLGERALREIDARAERADIPLVLVHTALDLRSADGRTWRERILAARTEKDLSDIFEAFTAQVPLGQRLLARWNPIRTRGPMQVNVAFAERFEQERAYPYPLHATLEDELFSRRGSLYFGIAHLLAYDAPYPRYLYRFADYNAGQYASRNAAFQHAVSVASGTALTNDGALLPADGGRGGATEAALISLAPRLKLDPAQIHAALEQGRQGEFERTALYQRVFALAEQHARASLPRALLPHIELHGPKLSRTLTTQWYARRVDGRFQRCQRG